MSIKDYLKSKTETIALNIIALIVLSLFLLSIGNKLFVNDNTLTVNITRIRNKIEEIGLKDFIKTKRGQGYII